ncbi:hypothetical protein FJW08_13855 [Mesorhizobium sp. B3-2-1]|uniref:hypothetical protein n=1 Tax=Mesorhizobium sp. B3-2-1 TaxID=2589891 RepID=UPI00112BC394|nr:hypothetical protein [Mesorhizobium sp. B3-2-1]TPI30696.1 hypothetical protein FJW08_13855 [Mesorhizobium sp. B3-2-1]
MSDSIPKGLAAEHCRLDQRDAETVRIVDDKASLEQVIAAANARAIQEPCVSSSVLKWRARRDSNS